jgi:hypothetical protein
MRTISTRLLRSAAWCRRSSGPGGKPDVFDKLAASTLPEPIAGHLNGKPAGLRCARLDDKDRCRLFGWPDELLMHEDGCPS